MILSSAILIGASYLLGSVPTAYLAGLWIRGTDVRRYGSGTVSASMVWEHVARWATIPVGAFDVAKAAIPTWIGLRLELGAPIAVAAGLAAVVGHNWPIFLRFTGGRGLGGFLGVMLVIFPLGSLWLLALLAIGWRLGDSTVWTLAGIVTLPLLARGVDGPAIMLSLSAAMLLLTFAKRLEGNRRPLPTNRADRWRVLVRRLVFDRDIRSHTEWIRRTPAD